MKDAYQNEYMDPEFPHVTEAWDTFQDRVCSWKILHEKHMIFKKLRLFYIKITLLAYNH